MRSQKRLEVQPMQPWPAPIGQLVPPFHLTDGQLLSVSGPLQPILKRHQPLR